MQNVTATQGPNGEIQRKFTRELPVTLNEHELQTYGKMLAEKVREEELAEERKKQVVAQHTNAIKGIRVEIKRIADARAKGEELRPVACGERIHGNVVEIVRLDRHEVVDTRPANLSDMQPNLPGVPELPDGPLDEGPRDEDFGGNGPDKSGRSVGVDVTSSAGETVHVGGDVDDPEMHDEETKLALVCNACSTPINEGDQTVKLDGATIHADCAPDDADVDLPTESEDDMIDRKLAERDAGDGDFGGAVSRKEASTAADAHAGGPAEKAKRDRSRKSNEAKGTSKSNGKAKKRR